MRAPAIPAVALAVLAVLGGVVWWQSGARWRGELYCFADPARVWGVAERPADLTPSCPSSQGVRREVRSGQTHVEQFTLARWDPALVRDLLTARGYAVAHALPDDGIQVEAVLTRAGETVLFTAAHQGAGTFVTLSSPGER
ncbi:hypothetical protein [Deinococcus sp. RM]|uniref:hypothetical protein n=1 Tax=Deinococcus sp. RM TaxID=2316359 RepID=UPI000E68686D|nr:hypothetical protein [Deinococcus sp. RM]RIY11726.1 hypothetical protein D3W47_05910 [Deinococcus sp. RM]